MNATDPQPPPPDPQRPTGIRLWVHRLQVALGLLGSLLVEAADLVWLLTRSSFFRPATGRVYEVGLGAKLRLLFRFIANNQRIKSASRWKEHLILATAILETPPTVEGVVVECGCFNGASTANLSLVCRLVGRRLWVFDSFEGLPQPREDEGLSLIVHKKEHYVFRQSQYQAREEVVRRNLERFGAPEVCHLVKGFFNQTLPGFDLPVITVFEDADLRSSVEDCLVHLWPRLREGGAFFCHEAWSQQVVQLFYDHPWWEEHLGRPAPGFYGSGSGMPLSPFCRTSSLGYSLKLDLAAYLRQSRHRPGM